MTATDFDFDEERVLEELEALHSAIRAAQKGTPASQRFTDAAAAEPVDGDVPPVPGSGPRRRVVLVVGIGAVAAVVSGVLLRPQTPRCGHAATGPACNSPCRAAAPRLAILFHRPPVDTHALRMELTVVRRVWIRVTVDGTVVLEQEVPAGAPLHFGADRTIIVRSGDAGGVAVRVNGIDQGPMGRDGQVLTRGFDAPAK